MGAGKVILGIVLFAVAGAILYVWGLRRSMTQAADLNRMLFGRCSSRILRVLKSQETITEAEAAEAICGVRAGLVWSKQKIAVQEPEKVAPQVLQWMCEQLLIEPAGAKKYRLKK